MRFDNRLLDEIRARLNLSDIVGRKVTWDRRKSQPGRGDYWACCPFHQEKSPSFHVDDRRGRYKCFGCGASGDHFRFLTETEGLSFPEAVEQLAETAGVPLPAPDPQAARREQKRAGLADVCEMATRFFQAEFAGPRGGEARGYAERRGLLPATLNEFRVGYAPDGRDALKRHLLGHGVDEAVMIEAGLVIRPEDGRPSYDRFRGRLIIPIHDERGRVVAFGGRTLLPDGQPKYLNSPETPLFHKGMMLFNVHRAREAAFKSGQAVVVEGYMDAIALYQAGLKHVVAALGTAFTEDQMVRLWRFAPEPVMCFDGDAAGISAAHRAIDRIFPILKSGYSFQFCFLPDGLDPDEMIRANGLPGFMAEVERAQPLSEVVWLREVQAAPHDTPERKAALEARIDSLIGTIRDERVKRRYQLDFRLKLSNLFFEERRRSFSQGRGRGRQNDRNRTDGGIDAAALSGPMPAPEGPLFGTERLVCGLCVRYPELLDRHLERISRLHFSYELHARFRDEICRVATDLDKMSVAGFYHTLDERFYQLMSEVMEGVPGLDAAQGGDDDSGGGPGAGPSVPRKSEAAGGFAGLAQRFPLLRSNPPEDFVESAFIHFVDVLELRTLEQELDEELRSENADISEETWNRIRALTQDLARRKEECAREEAELAERAKKLKGHYSTLLEV